MRGRKKGESGGLGREIKTCRKNRDKFNFPFSLKQYTDKRTHICDVDND